MLGYADTVSTTCQEIPRKSLSKDDTRRKKILPFLSSKHSRPGEKRNQE
jgi:hypothetical protein